MKLRDANLQVNEKTLSHIFIHAFCLHFLRILTQARNQTFFRAGEFPWSQGTSINIHQQPQRRMALQGNVLYFFCLETLKNRILTEKFYPQMTTIRTFCLQIWALFSNFRKRAGGTSPSTPSSYALVTTTFSEKGFESEPAQFLLGSISRIQCCNLPVQLRFI